MSNLAFAYQASDRREDALAVQSEILQIQTKKFGVEHPTTLILMRNLAGNYLKLDRPEDALSILEECLTIRTKLHPSSWKTFEVQSDLGEALFKLDRIEEAIPNLKEGYEGLNQNAEKIPLSSRKNKLKKALLRLRELAESQEQPTEFTKWQQELDSLDSTKESR